MRYNIFQGSKSVKKVIYETLGYEIEENMTSMITSDIYFEAYFYLCNRFGTPYIVDDYKKVMIWAFEVKQYTIEIQLNSGWVTFIIYGNGSDKNILSKNNFSEYSSRKPYWVRYWRECEKKKSELINIYSNKKSKNEKLVINKLFEEFSLLHNIDDTWTNKRFQKEKMSEWIKYLQEYNNKILNTDSFKHLLEKDIYSNSKTKHALKTLRQFLNNMLTPIYIRDVPYNIKGGCIDNFDRYVNNIKIEFKNK